MALTLGGFNLTPQWEVSLLGLGSAGGPDFIVYNPASPTERFFVDKNSQELNQIIDYLGGLQSRDDFVKAMGKTPEQEQELTRSFLNEKSIQDIAEQERISGYQSQYDSGQISGDQMDSLLNTPPPKPAETTRSLSGDSENQAGPSFDQALLDVYNNRTDLQSLYNSDGSAKNPSDPRIAGIPTLQEWAQKYGINEEASLKTAQQQQSNTAATKTAQQLGLTGVNAELYTQLKAQLDALQKKGQAINPNVQITPAKLAEFLKIASKEIDPYYQTQLKLAKDSFLTSVGYTRDQILREEQDLERKYGQQVRNIGEDAAERGFAQSGRRQLDEQNLATDTQNTIDNNRRSLAYQAGNTARQFAQQYGSAALSNPTLQSAPRVLAGQGAFQKSGDQNPFYQLSPEVYQGLVGSQQYEQDAAKRRRVSELEDAYRTGQGITQQRQLTL